MTAPEANRALPAVVDPTGLDETPDGRLRRLTAAWLASKPSKRTQDGYLADLRCWLAFLADHDLDPLRVGRDVADVWADHLRNAVHPGGWTYRPATVSRRLTAVASWYAYLEDVGQIARNPFEKVARPAVSRDGTTAALTEAQFKQFLAAAGGAEPNRRALVYLCFLVGLRVSEACSLDFADLGEHDGHRVLRVTVKGNREYVVLDELAALHGGTGPILRRQDGERLDRQTARRWCVRLGEIEKISVRTHPHVGRASGATRLWEQGVPANRIVAWGRWQSVQTAERYDRGGKQLDGHCAYLLGAQLLGEAS
jgi:integrase/recombinase XerD